MQAVKNKNKAVVKYLIYVRTCANFFAAELLRDLLIFPFKLHSLLISRFHRHIIINFHKCLITPMKTFRTDEEITFSFQQQYGNFLLLVFIVADAIE